MLTSFINWFLGKTEEERKIKTYYIKSLLFLFIITINIANQFTSIADNIIKLLGYKIVSYILLITKIGLQFWTTLSVISFIVSIVSTIAYVILVEISENNLRIDYYNRLSKGSKIRFSYCVEDILILLLVSLFLDRNIYDLYRNSMSELLWYFLWSIMILEFLFSSLKGILNRFFLLRSKDENK